MFRSKSIWLALAVLPCVGASLESISHAKTALTADEIVSKAVARIQETDGKGSRSAYSYTKVSLTEQFDSAGKMREHKEKVYQVSFQHGVTRVKLVEVNGRPPGEADLKKQAENELNLHQILGQSKSANGDNRESFLTPELAAKFDFSLKGESVVNGRPAFQIQFQPKDPPPPMRHIVDRLLNRISGALWIDAQEFEIARADVQLRSEVDLLGGVVGCLKKLDYTTTRTRFADGVWLTSFSSGDFQGRKLLDSLRIKTKSQCTNFHPMAQSQPSGLNAG